MKDVRWGIQRRLFSPAVLRTEVSTEGVLVRVAAVVMKSNSGRKGFI